MASTKGGNPWDVVVEVYGKFVFFDRREKWTGDMVTVAENAPDNVLEDVNLNALSLEATQLNQRFSQQVLLKDKRVNGAKPHPFIVRDDDDDVIV